MSNQPPGEAKAACPPTTLGTAKSGGWLGLESRDSETPDVARQAAGLKSTFFP